MRPSLLSVLLLAACAPAFVTPRSTIPLDVWRQKVTTAVAVPAPAPGATAPIREYDSTSGYTRHMVTTHAGVYTGWVQKPQISFYALTLDSSPTHQLPASVALLVRTLEPDAVTGPRLILECPERSDTLPVAVHSDVIRTGNTQSHFLTYLLPSDHLATFAGCNQGSLTVGTRVSRFDVIQLSTLRGLLLELGASRVAPAF